MMDFEESKISMISMISSSDYNKGRLKLALPFYFEYGDALPVELKLVVKCGGFWNAKYVRDSLYIEGVKTMMVSYGLRTYHLVLLTYIGNGQFNINCYTPYAVEMKYPVDNRISHGPGNCNAVEEGKLCSTYYYNVVHNFVGLYNLQIESTHLVVNSYTKVLSEYACYKLGLTETVKFIRIGYEDHEWRIKLKFINGEAWFCKNWLNFVLASHLLPGDIIVLYKTPSAFVFQISVFDRKTIADEALGADVGSNLYYGNFYKVMNSESFETGELELPRVFRNNYGYTLGDILHIKMDGGYSTKFKYCATMKKIHGLFRFIQKYSIRPEYVIFFNYLGDSTFSVSVYDCDFMDHFRNTDGYIRVDVFITSAYDMELVFVSSDSEDNRTEPLCDCIDIIKIDDTYKYIDREEFVDSDPVAFNCILKESHVDANGEGLVIPECMHSVYQSWEKTTLIRLNLAGRHWFVQVMYENKVCEFGIGWHDFTFDNHLRVGQQISFQFLGDLSFEVAVDS